MIKENIELIESLIDAEIFKWNILINFFNKRKGEKGKTKLPKLAIERLKEMKRLSGFFYDDKYPLEKIKEKLLKKEIENLK